MIRRADISDWPEVDRMARAFRDAATPWIGYRPEAMRRTFEGIVKSPAGVGLMPEAGGGVLLAFAMPSPFSGELVAQELLWWIDPQVRGGRTAGAMLAAYEAWAREVGAAHCGVTCLDERAARLFGRRGYARAETIYRVY